MTTDDLTTRLIHSNAEMIAEATRRRLDSTPTFIMPDALPDTSRNGRRGPRRTPRRRRFIL